MAPAESFDTRYLEMVNQAEDLVDALHRGLNEGYGRALSLEVKERRLAKRITALASDPETLAETSAISALAATRREISAQLAVLRTQIKDLEVRAECLRLSNIYEGRRLAPPAPASGVPV